MNTKHHVLTILVLLLLNSFFTYMVNSEVKVERKDNLLIINNGFIEIEFLLDRGGAIRDIRAVHSDFIGTPVSKGITAIRGGGPNTNLVLFDIISNNNPWFGVALTAQTSYEILESTNESVLIKMTYTLGDPFPGLKVVKTINVPVKSFLFYVNVTLENTGGAPLSIDLSGPWGRPVGYMVEIVALMGASAGDESRFVLLNDGMVEAFPASESFVNYVYEGRLKGIGIYDRTTESSPWGFMWAVFCLDNETVAKTYGIWLETGAGGENNIINRIEFKAVTLQPGERVEYRLMMYAGPIHRDYLVKQLGFSEKVFNDNFYNPEFEVRPPGVTQYVYEYSFSTVAVSDKLEELKSVPRTAVKVLSTGGDLVNLVTLNRTLVEVGIPYDAVYIITVDPLRGFTADGLYEFEFIGVVLPNGTFIQNVTAEVFIRHGDEIKLVFQLKPLAKVKIKLVTPDKIELPVQAGDINVTVKVHGTDIAVFTVVSKVDSRTIEVWDRSTTPPIPGLRVGNIYVIEVPYESGLYRLDKVYVNNVEKRFRVTDGKAVIVLDETLTTGGVYELELVYAPVGGFKGLYVWVGVIVGFIALAIVLTILKKKSTRK